MLVRFRFRGICEEVLPSLASDRDDSLDPPPAGLLIPHGLHSHPRNVDQAEEIDFLLCPDRAI